MKTTIAVARNRKYTKILNARGYFKTIENIIGLCQPTRIVGVVYLTAIFVHDIGGTNPVICGVNHTERIRKGSAPDPTIGHN